MLRWERMHIGLEEWARLVRDFDSHTVFQSASWLRFLQDCFAGELVFAVLRDGATECGYFAGMVVTKLGLRLLGSPLPGWTTSYMGFVLRPGISRLDALDALRCFVFEDLKCVHMELMDRQLASSSLASRYTIRNYAGFELDLSPNEDRLFSNFAPACRRCIRKSSRCGVIIEEAGDQQFAVDYYEQLKDVFARQGLAPTYGISRVRSLISNLWPTGNLLLLRARDADGHCIATGIFPALNDRAYFWGGASWRQHQHLRPNENLMWHAIRHWKSRGIRFFDFSGSGDYKSKYGPYEIQVPWLHVSRYPLLPLMRNGAKVMSRLRQRSQGAWQFAHAALTRQHIPSAICTPADRNNASPAI